VTLTLDLGSQPQPLAFAPALRSLLADAYPTALLEDVALLDDLPTGVKVLRIGMSVATGLSLLAILLSTTALYALMSMTVAQRRREIGIRLALGGSARGVMATVARRALVQIAAGVALGAGFWVVVLSSVLAGGEVERVLAGWPYLIAAAAAVVMATGLAASLGPVLRYVRMEPVETLRADG
jgi:putative ABC transport system permease protein